MNDDANPTKSLAAMYSPDSPDAVSSPDPGSPEAGGSTTLAGTREVYSTNRSLFGVAILFAVLIAWCVVIAIGSFQTQASTDYRRPLIVMLTMGSFLGIWAVALVLRGKRGAKQ